MDQLALPETLGVVRVVAPAIGLGRLGQVGQLAREQGVERRVVEFGMVGEQGQRDGALAQQFADHQRVSRGLGGIGRAFVQRGFGGQRGGLDRDAVDGERRGEAGWVGGGW